jgi:hypothetical protein
MSKTEIELRMKAIALLHAIPIIPRAAWKEAFELLDAIKYSQAAEQREQDEERKP